MMRVFVRVLLLPVLLGGFFFPLQARPQVCPTGKYRKVTTSSASTLLQDCDDVYLDLLNAGKTATSGKHSINPGGSGAFSVYCDFDTAGGPWTVFQKRTGPKQSFYQTWNSYRDGFGDVASDHWLGFTKMLRIIQLGSTRMRINMEQNGNGGYYAEYSHFAITGSDYTLSLSGFKGNAGDSLSYHSGRRWSTYDRDIDDCWANCASTTWYYGAWWYGCCHVSNLNGLYGYTGYAKGPVWRTGFGYYDPLEKTQMAMRSVKDPPAPVITCEPCSSGKYQATNDFSGKACTDCSAGYFSDQAQQAACKGCSPGQYQTTSGQTSCVDCAAGTYTSASAHTSCKECGVGQYQKNAGSSSCKNCAKGKYQSQNLQVTCKDCSKGQHQNQIAATTCKNCPAGKFSGVAAQEECSSCQAGTYQDGVGAEKCKKCDKGQFTPNTGEQECKECASGTYMSQKGATVCSGTCSCGYFCGPGSINSQATVCGEGYYCPAGTVSRISIGGHQGLPVGSNPARFCDKETCPTGSVCVDGVAFPLLEWGTPRACKSESSDSPYIVQIEESTLYSEFGEPFTVDVQDSLDNSDYRVDFSIERWPGSAPSGCGASRSDKGLASEPSDNWLFVQTSAGAKPSECSGKLGTSKPLDAEACTTDFAAAVSATVFKINGNSTLGKITCYTNIRLANQNENPTILSSSLQTREVAEDKLPGYAIGPKLQAFDAEASAGLQQLSWRIETCEAFTFGRTPSERSWQPDMIALGQSCPLRLSSCDGQISIASGTILNYETYTKYRLVVQVTDDGSPAYSSSQIPAARTVVINVLAKNDKPTIVAHQSFYIKENVQVGTLVNLQSRNGTLCNSHLKNNSACEIMASDVDSNSTGFQFVQAVTQDPFTITAAATRHAVGTDSQGNNAYNIFTTITFVGPALLDYESGNTNFDLSVYAQDGDGARTVNQCMVTIIVTDDNDRPNLNIPEICGETMCVHIEENNNEGSNREVNLLEDVEDPDTLADWKCCASSDPFTLLSAASLSSDACPLSKFEVNAKGFAAIAGEWNFENGDSCDVIVRVTDKGGKVSEDHLIHVKVENINDPPEGVSMIGTCEVEENTNLYQQLPVDSTYSCKLEATDEDDTVFVFLKDSPLSITGSKGYYFSSLAGASDEEKWASLDYFNVETNGKFTVAQVPDYEMARSLTFDVFARDSKGQLSSKQAITINIKDVNEPPIINATMIVEPMASGLSSGHGNNLLCTAKFTTTEYKKDGAGNISGQLPKFLYNRSAGVNSTLYFTAGDPDQGAADSAWNDVHYSLTPGYYDSDVFSVDADSGAIAPRSSHLEFLDFEMLTGRVGVQDGYMRINAVASDGGGEKTDCDIFIEVVDINEPPVIGHIDGNRGESKDHAFVIKSKNVSIGDNVGPVLPVHDPDVVAKDTASCREASLSGLHLDDDRELFGITKSCQIFVKNLMNGGKNLNSGTNTEYYTLYVQAFDSGGRDGNVLFSAKRMYHIHGQAGLIPPVFDIGNTMFKQKENIAHDIEGQDSISTKNYSYWNVGRAQKLFVACTDDNVFQRGTTNDNVLLAGERIPACGTYNGSNACEGSSSAQTTGCEFVQADQRCITRQQALRYQIEPSTTFPELPRANMLKIDSVTAKMSFATHSTSANYEKLLIPDAEILCDLGPPVRIGNGTNSNPYKWIGRFPNGVKGICRMFDKTEMKRSGKKERRSYLDAAALCARGGARLPTLLELREAVNTRFAVTVEGIRNEGVNGEPALSKKGGKQGEGKYPLRPMNILDLWNWEKDSELSGYAPEGDSACRRSILSLRSDDNICDDGTTSNPCSSSCPDKSGIDQPLRVWTYNGKQASFLSGGTSLADDIWENPENASSVEEVQGSVNMQETLPVLCHVGENYVNHAWHGNSDTPSAYSQKVSKPVRGYSSLVRCMDTSDYTVSESRFEFSPQSFKDEKYIFVEIEDVEEDPYVDQQTLEVYINENNEPGSLAVKVTGRDEDPGDAMNLTFQLSGISSPNLPFALGEPKPALAYASSRDVHVNTEISLDFESLSMFQMSVSIRDPTGRSTSQFINVHVNDVNEPPELRQLSDPAQPSSSTYHSFRMSEDASENHEIGELKAWDPDRGSLLLFDVSGPDNMLSGNSIFGILSTNRTSSGAEGTGSMTVAVLELRDPSSIDYETKRMYVLDLIVSDGALSDQAKLEVEIDNVNDVTVTDVFVEKSGQKILQTSGNERVHIAGTNFGIKYQNNQTLAPELRILYGRVDKEYEQWFEAANCSLNNTGFDNTLIVCDSVPGYGADLVWKVEILRRASQQQEGIAVSSVKTDYAAPVILSLSTIGGDSINNINSLNTTGGQMVVLKGKNFGAVGLALEGYYSANPSKGWYCAKDCHVTSDYDEVTCLTSPGIGSQLVWKLEKINSGWFGPVTNMSITSSYALPSITDVANCASCSTPDRKEFSTYGNQDVFLSGKNFGPQVHASDACTPSDVGAIFVEYKNDIGYHYKQTVRCEITIPHEQMKCKTVAGVSRNFKWAVTVAGQTSEWSSNSAIDTTSYTLPEITALTGSGAYNANTRGGQKFYVEGDFFGPKSMCAGIGSASAEGCIDKVEFETTDAGTSLAGHVFEGVSCKVINAQTLIECTSPEGVGKNFAYKVTIGDQSSPLNSNLVRQGTDERPSYGRPVLSILSRSTGQSLSVSKNMNDADTRGFTVTSVGSPIYSNGIVPETILISGSNFGPVSAGHCRKNGFPCMADSDCFNSESANNTCDGVGIAVMWNDISATYKSIDDETGEFSADFYSASSCAVVESHSKIKCNMAEGAGKGHEWIVKVGGQTSLTPTSSYHKPEIFSVSGEGAIQGSTNGLQTVLLNGLNFGLSTHNNDVFVTYGATGTEYIPSDCSVLSHEKIQCKTAPGIGKDLYWRVTVQGQSSILDDNGQTSYSSPYIHSISPDSVSADGSNIRDFLVFLNVSNSGLADPLARIFVQMDPACKVTIPNSCGPYEIPVENRSPTGSRLEGDFDILAFRVPMLKNQKRAEDISVSIIAYGIDRQTGSSLRDSAVKSLNSVKLSYKAPYIEQIVVAEHPSINGARILTIIGKNFGSIDIGEYPETDSSMRVNNVPLQGGPSVPLPMQLGVNINDPSHTGTFVQKWERGAESERYDEIVIIWSGNYHGKVSISRGGATSNEVEFKDLSPKILSAGWNRILSNGNSEILLAVPTLGSKIVNPKADHEIQMEIKCRNCGSSKQRCCRNRNRTDCDINCYPHNIGLPKLVEIWLGSAQLADSDLQKCPIVNGTSRYDEASETWTYRCQIPPYQGRSVDTRLKFDGRWSNATTTRYLAPTIESLKSQANLTRVTDTPPVLFVRTRGERINITGRNFGKPFAGDVTGFNQNYVIYNDGISIHRIRPTIRQQPPHGGLSIYVPSGTSNLLRSIDVQIGQYKVDVQSTEGHSNQIPSRSTTMFVAYRKPTLVSELVPLWRFNEDQAGGFNVTIYGFDFMTADQADTYDSINQSTKIWFRAEYNETSGNFWGTPCIPISTTYTKIVCHVGDLIPMKTQTTEDDVAIAVTVDGQTTVGFLSKIDVAKAKLATASGVHSEDDEMITMLSEERNQAFQSQVDHCMSLSQGLIPSLHAFYIEPTTDPSKVVNEQDLAFKTEDSSLSPRQIEIRQCVSVVVNAFSKACSGTDTVESKALLEASYKKDESEGRLNTRQINVCARSGEPPIKDDEDGSTGSIAGPGLIGPDLIANSPDNSLAAPPTPTVVDIKCNSCDIQNLRTQGGNVLYVRTQGLTVKYKFRAYLIDDAGKYPPIPMKGGVSGSYVIQQTDYETGSFFGNLTLIVPPGQGSQRRLFLESIVTFAGVPLRSDGGQSFSDTVGYGRPWINTTLTQLPIQTSTDACLPNQYESQLAWAARVENLRSGFVDGVQLDVDQIQKLDESMYERRCLKYDTVELWGENFGEDLTQLQVWVEGKKMSSASSSTTASETIVFWVYNGTGFTQTLNVHSDILNRGFAGESPAFTLLHSHNHLVLRGPKGYGAYCTLHIKVADQTTLKPIEFSFKSPTADYSEPRAYDARGEEIIIHGQNFGGVESVASIRINGEICDDALWHRQHDVVGLPYVSCRAKETVAGIANVSLHVAGQTSSFLISKSLKAAGVRTVCRESRNSADLNLETGRAIGYWGRNEPVGEICAPCQDGSFCSTGTYKAPESLAGYYMVELDISNKNAKLETDTYENTLISRREMRDYERSLETFRSNGKRLCPRERLFDPDVDADLIKQFPFAASTKREMCLVAMPCKPAEACKGRNECELGYEYQKNRCNTSEARLSLGGSEITQMCNHTLQCQSRSAGLRCAEAISSVCGCPAEWELGSRKCLKQCLRSQKQLLEQAGCSTSILAESLSGAPCAYNRPEDCATCESKRVCVTGAGVETGIACSSRADCIESAGFDGSCEHRGRCQCGPSSRCILCTAGTHYRLDGKCEPCPENIELTFALFFIGICTAIVFAYILDQKDFNLAFLIIPVDYFQVLALLSRADIRWPSLLLDVLRALQFFNFNLDIATPECLLAGVFTYEMKFYFTLCFAPAVVVILFLAFLWHQFFRRCCLCRKPDKLYASKLVGTFMLLIYCVYLSCTTRALEVFNCSPTDPDDGWEYVDFTDPTCDGGGLCRCWDPEHLPYKLLLPALLSVGVYTLGFPLFLFWLFRCGNRKAMLKEDQILRAMGLGDSLATNPRAYHVRVRYHKMYYYYRPSKSYWMLVILARKVGIAFCALIFRTNPGFMLASVLLILFMAFSLQTRHSPYMSASQRQLVLAEHSIKAESGNAEHRFISKNIQHVKATQKQKKFNRKHRTKQQTLGNLDFEYTNRQDGLEMTKSQYLFDYNTVELALLFCAVIVCLAGVMFESDRFKVTDEDGTLRYRWQRDLVTYLVILVVFLSFVYLLIVMSNEITGWTPDCLLKCFKRKTNALLSAADTIQNQKDDHIEMNIVNPALIRGTKQVDNAAHAKLQARLAEEKLRSDTFEKQAEALAMERRRIAKVVQSQKSENNSKARKKLKKGKTKKEFASQKATLLLEADKAAAAMQIDTSQQTRSAKSKSFRKYVTSSGKEYFSNIETNETTWTLPDDAVVMD